MEIIDLDPPDLSAFLDHRVDGRDPPDVPVFEGIASDGSFHDEGHVDPGRPVPGPEVDSLAAVASLSSVAGSAAMAVAERTMAATMEWRMARMADQTESCGKIF